MILRGLQSFVTNGERRMGWTDRDTGCKDVYFGHGQFSRMRKSNCRAADVKGCGDGISLFAKEWADGRFASLLLR